jgi:hypothetical protein
VECSRAAKSPQDLLHSAAEEFVFEDFDSGFSAWVTSGEVASNSITALVSNAAQDDFDLDTIGDACDVTP